MEFCYFAGGNSGEGFYDCFSQMIPDGEKKEHIVILKGGPGVGKSTLMKRIAEAAKKKKEDTELFFCSGDPDSLDAVRLKKRGFLILDGTAPHSKDPVFPGAVDEIMNLGEQIDREKIREHRAKIEQLSAENKEFYVRAYATLAAAAVLERERYREVTACIDHRQVEKLRQRLCGFSEEKKESKSRERRLFLDAITWKGKVSHAAYAVQSGKSLGLNGVYANVVLDCLSTKTTDCPRERFLQPLCPEHTAHMYLPDAELFVTGEGFETDETMEADSFMKEEPPQELLRYQKEEERLLALAVKNLKVCKKVHDELEAIYRNCVDFDKITERTERLLMHLGL